MTLDRCAPLTKPSRLARDVSKWERRKNREKAKQREARQAANKWKAISAQVKHRDGGRCRVCGEFTFDGGHPERIGSAHHIVYRSAGGTDEMSNLIWTDARCHDAEHRHVISITGTSDNLKVERNV